ncbi:MAG: hypothetical protein KAG43_10785 [Candidatus Marithrix sp.]|nr:hypothetical protein [Candidatus Marithrix sp.]
MYAHRIETTINEVGTINLDTLPFAPGDKVEIIFLKRETADNVQQPPISFAKAAQEFCGKIEQAPTDLSTNPAYFQGFGE